MCGLGWRGSEASGGEIRPDEDLSDAYCTERAFSFITNAPAILGGARDERQKVGQYALYGSFIMGIILRLPTSTPY